MNEAFDDNLFNRETFPNDPEFWKRCLSYLTAKLSEQTGLHFDITRNNCESDYASCGIMSAKPAPGTLNLQLSGTITVQIQDKHVHVYCVLLGFLLGHRISAIDHKDGSIFSSRYQKSENHLPAWESLMLEEDEYGEWSNYKKFGSF